MSPTNEGRERFGRSLGIPGYRALYGSAVVAALGGSISDVAVSWIVYHYTHNALDISLLGLVGFLPAIVLGLFAGVAADRYNRRNLMVAADSTRFALMGTLTVLFVLWGFSLVPILVVMLLVYSVGSLFTPASQSIIASIVPKENLEDATGLLQGSNSAMGSIGSALGGVVVAVFGPTWGLGTNALTYALSALFLVQIATQLGVPHRETPAAKKSVKHDLSEGLGYVVRQKLLPVTFGYLPVNLLGAMVQAFIVVYSATRFGSSALDYGALAAATAVGIAFGSLIPGRFRTRRVAGLLMGTGILVSAGMIALIAVTPFLAVAFAAFLVQGIEIGATNTVYYATIQAVVPREILGRVMSASDFGSFAAIPAGLVLGGLLISRVGVELDFLYASLGLFFCGAVLLSLPSFRAFGRQDLPEPASA